MVWEEIIFTLGSPVRDGHVPAQLRWGIIWLGDRKSIYNCKVTGRCISKKGGKVWSVTSKTIPTVIFILLTFQIYLTVSSIKTDEFQWTKKFCKFCFIFDCRWKIFNTEKKSLWQSIMWWLESSFFLPYIATSHWTWKESKSKAGHEYFFCLRTYAWIGNNPPFSCPRSPSVGGGSTNCDWGWGSRAIFFSKVNTSWEMTIRCH